MCVVLIIVNFEILIKFPNTASRVESGIKAHHFGVPGHVLIVWMDETSAKLCSSKKLYYYYERLAFHFVKVRSVSSAGVTTQSSSSSASAEAT